MNRRIRTKDSTYDISMLWLSFEMPIVPQKFISVVSVQPDHSPHLPLPSVSFISYSPYPPLSTSPSSQIGCSVSLEQPIAVLKTHCLSAWWMDQWGQKGGMEMEAGKGKVTVFLNHNLKCLTLESDTVDLWDVSCRWHHMVGWLNEHGGDSDFGFRGEGELRESQLWGHFLFPSCKAEGQM